ncbi:MAG: DUF4307 domain-containing protein [Angustibacter sp.]
MGDRYGPPPRRRRWLVQVGSLAVLAAVGLAWVVWAGLDLARADVRWTDVGFRVEGDDAVQVTYDVGKAPQATAVCRLHALDRSKSTVGIIEVTVGPSERRVIRRTDRVRTSALAVTGLVDSCRIR